MQGFQQEINAFHMAWEWRRLLSTGFWSSGPAAHKQSSSHRQFPETEPRSLTSYPHLWAGQPCSHTILHPTRLTTQEPCPSVRRELIRQGENAGSKGCPWWPLSVVIWATRPKLPSPEPLGSMTARDGPQRSPPTSRKSNANKPKDGRQTFSSMAEDISIITDLHSLSLFSVCNT